jgi:cysteinyl-tRNA synthetase
MQAWQEVKDAVNQEIEKKTAILEAAMPDTNPAEAYLISELTSFIQDLMEINTALETMYENNEFYMQNITDIAQRAVRYIE